MVSNKTGIIEQSTLRFLQSNLIIIQKIPIQGMERAIDTNSYQTLVVIPNTQKAAKTKIEDNKIIFMHYANKYQCNPSYICDELIKQGLNYDIVFVADKKTINSPYFPEEIRLVKRNSLEHFYEMATT